MRKVLLTVIICAAASAMLVLNGCGKKDESQSQAQAGPQITCPVMEGGKIDKGIYEDYEGKRVYFCCSSCKAAFKADPEKYMKKMADEGVVLEDTP